MSYKQAAQQRENVTFLPDDEGVKVEETLRGVTIPLDLAESSARSESVSEDASAGGGGARTMQASSFFSVILGRDSAGSGRAGTSGRAAGEGNVVRKVMVEAARAGVFCRLLSEGATVSSDLELDTDFLPWLRNLMTP
jgi:hypothetical protein